MLSLYFSNRSARNYFFVTWRMLHDDQTWNTVEERSKAARRIEDIFSGEPYQCAGYVLFADHVHMVVGVPENESLDLLMHRFEREMTMLNPLTLNIIHFRPSFLSYPLQDSEDIEVAQQYLVQNPAKHGLKDSGFVLKLFALDTVSLQAGEAKKTSLHQDDALAKLA